MRSTTATAAWVALALALSGCGLKPVPPEPARQPNGSREMLRTGHWAGTIQSTLINFYINRVMGDRVAIQLNGGIITPGAHNTPGNPVSFTDRPTTCRRRPDGVTFDCLRYKDMHIDNGFLCGTYVLYGEVFHPCFAPVP
jgi:hypothetical protein